MSRNLPDREQLTPELSADEIAIVKYCRTQKLSKDEALNRLATIPRSPTLEQGQELAANLAAVATELSKSRADPTTLSGHDEPA